MTSELFYSRARRQAGNLKAGRYKNRTRVILGLLANLKKAAPLTKIKGAES